MLKSQTLREVQTQLNVNMRPFRSHILNDDVDE